MQPFYVADKLKDSYKRYVDSTFPVRPGPLRDEIERMVNDDALLWRGPYVSLAHPFKMGETLQELAAQKMITPQTATVFSAYESLYLHQSEATKRLCLGRNTIVATGTGSGKTESFLIPIIDECIRRKGEKGVKAVLVYPMNALANDQLERLRKLLKDCPDVSFGRFTGEVGSGDARPPEAPPNESYTRSEVRENQPDILITNYTMLELMLKALRSQAVEQAIDKVNGLSTQFASWSTRVFGERPVSNTAEQNVLANPNPPRLSSPQVGHPDVRQIPPRLQPCQMVPPDPSDGARRCNAERQSLPIAPVEIRDVHLRMARPISSRRIVESRRICHIPSCLTWGAEAERQYGNQEKSR
jgi:hypothetical protein